MTENLGEPNQIVAIVSKVLMANVWRSRCGCSFTPMIALYLLHNARKPQSVSGPRSPTNKRAEATGGRVSK